MTDITAEQEHAAMEWLKYLATGDPKHMADQVLALLSRPVLPEEPTHETIVAMQNARPTYYYQDCKEVYAALYAHLTKPKTKKAWRVDGNATVTLNNVVDAVAHALRLMEAGEKNVLITEITVPT